MITQHCPGFLYSWYPHFFNPGPIFLSTCNTIESRSIRCFARVPRKVTSEATLRSGSSLLRLTRETSLRMQRLMIRYGLTYESRNGHRPKELIRADVRAFKRRTNRLTRAVPTSRVTRHTPSLLEYRRSNFSIRRSLNISRLAWTTSSSKRSSKFWDSLGLRLPLKGDDVLTL